MFKRFLFSPWFTLTFYLIALPSAWALVKGWNRPLQPASPSSISSVIPFPGTEGRLLVATREAVLASEPTKQDSWMTLWPIVPSEVSPFLKSFPVLPDAVFVVTKSSLYAGNVKSGSWKRSFTTGKEDEDLLCFAVSPDDPDRWFAGTTHGLSESADGGKTWFPSRLDSKNEGVHELAFSGGRLLIAGADSLYAAGGSESAVQVFSLSGQEPSETDEENAQTPGRDGRLHDLLFHPEKAALGWLATDRGIFETFDGGDSWKALPSSGLKTSRVNHLAYAAKSGKLIAGTADGIYAFDRASGRWAELYAGLAGRVPKDLRVLENEKDETLAAVTAEGVVFLPLNPLEVPDLRENPSRAQLSMLNELFRLEPSARDLQLAIIRHSNTASSKTERWHRESRLKALLPSFSFGRSYSTGTTIDLDRGGTSDPDRYILGPADKSRDFDMDVSWHFSDLVYSSDQTSIDSREKLMVELRNDLLAEATRIYFERRRVQMQIVLAPPANVTEHLDMLTRMDELTALLDGLSGGFFGDRVADLYRKRPDLEALWSFDAVGMPEGGLNEIPGNLSGKT